MINIQSRQVIAGCALGVSALLVAAGCGDNKSGGKKDAPAAVVDPNGGQTPGGQTPGGVAADPSKYGLAFVTPDAEETTAGEVVAVEVKFNSVPAGSTWSLYYGTKAASFEDTTAIVTDLPMTTTTMNWETSFVEAGTYFLYAVVKSGETTTIYNAPGSVVVTGTANDGRTPFVVLTQPGNSRVYSPNSTITNVPATIPIQWTATDPDGEQISVRIEYAVDGESNWQEIVGDLNADTTSYTWTLPTTLARGARYKVRVVAKDASNKEGNALSRVFGISDVVITYNGHLKAILDAKCVSCHGATAPANNLRLDQYNDTANGNAPSVANRRQQMADRTGPAETPARRMPRGGTPLTQSEIDLFQLFNMFNGPEGP